MPLQRSLQTRYVVDESFRFDNIADHRFLLPMHRSLSSTSQSAHPFLETNPSPVADTLRLPASVGLLGDGGAGVNRQVSSAVAGRVVPVPGGRGANRLKNPTCGLKTYCNDDSFCAGGPGGGVGQSSDPTGERTPPV